MKLNAVIIDNHVPTLEVVKDFCNDSKLINVVETFNNSPEFINASSSLEFDLCLLDTNLLVIDGLTVAKLLNGKPFIFVTSSQDRLNEALHAAPIDIVSKPVEREKLCMALEKTYRQVKEGRAVKNTSDRIEKEYAAFNTNLGRNKIVLKLNDIFFVYSDIKDTRNKNVIMRDGTVHLLMNYTFEYILAVAPCLVRPNGSELVSMELVKDFGHDVITISLFTGSKKQITLSRTYKNEFYSKLG